MAIGSGLGAQLGIGVESTYGTAVTPTWFPEFVSESLGRENLTITSNGLRAGTRNLRRASRRVLTGRQAAGDTQFEVPTTGFGKMLNHITGGTSTIAQQGGTPAYLQTHALGDLDGKYMTVQKGVPQTDGTVKAFTFEGGKVASATFANSVDSLLTCAVTWDFEDAQTATALATASYSNTKLFHFMQGAITLAGSPVAQVLDWDLTINNNLKTDRFYLGSSGVKKEPLPNDYPEVSGTVGAEFVSQATIYDVFAADTSVALVLTYTGDLISGAHYETLTITVPVIKFGGETPKVGGPEVVTLSAPFEGLYDGTNPGVTITYKSTDTAI